jgi:hypothetical protein
VRIGIYWVFFRHCSFVGIYSVFCLVVWLGGVFFHFLGGVYTGSFVLVVDLLFVGGFLSFTGHILSLSFFTHCLGSDIFFWVMVMHLERFFTVVFGVIGLECFGHGWLFFFSPFVAWDTLSLFC